MSKPKKLSPRNTVKPRDWDQFMKSYSGKMVNEHSKGRANLMRFLDKEAAAWKAGRKGQN